MSEREIEEENLKPFELVILNQKQSASPPTLLPPFFIACNIW